MICPFCQQTHDNEGDRYGCPNCHGEGLTDMKDLAPLYRDRAGRRHTERNGLWYFAAGFIWAMVLVVIVGGIA